MQGSFLPTAQALDWGFLGKYAGIQKDINSVIPSVPLYTALTLLLASPQASGSDAPLLHKQKAEKEGDEREAPLNKPQAGAGLHCRL